MTQRQTAAKELAEWREANGLGRSQPAPVQRGAQRYPAWWRKKHGLPATDYRPRKRILTPRAPKTTPLQAIKQSILE